MLIAWDYYAWVAVKLGYAFLLILFFFQFSGSKRQLAQMTSIDLISNFILGGIVGGFIYDEDISLSGFFLVIAAYFIIMYMINYLRNNTAWGRKIMVGVPTIIISDGKLDVDKLKRMKISMTDFMSLLRHKKIHTIQSIKLAQIEIDGQLTIVKKGGEDYATLLIDNGVINEEGLKEIKKSKLWLKKQLSQKGYKDISKIFCAQWLHGQFYVIQM